MTQRVTTRKQAFDRAQTALARAGVDAPSVDSLVLLSRASNCSKLALLSDPDEPLSPQEHGRFLDLLHLRSERVPLAHLTGEKEFHSLPFDMDPGVFVPRFETEGLVDLALEFLRSRTAPLRVLDLCTGSGVIAVTLAVKDPRIQVQAVDQNPEAAALARRNAERHGTGDRVLVHEGDLYEPLHPLETFDLIVSNPPYVAPVEWSRLNPEARRDPPEALLGGPDGCAIIQRILEGAPSRLAEDGALFLEIGETQGSRCASLARTAGIFPRVEIRPDLSARPRYLTAERKHGKADH